MIIGFVLFLILILALIIYESSQRYNYVEETRKVWAGFKRDKEALFGFSLKFMNVDINTLKKDPKGGYYNNGRKVK